MQSNRRTTLRKKATIHQVTTMLATSKNILFPGHNLLLTTGTDDLTLWLLPEQSLKCDKCSGTMKDYFLSTCIVQDLMQLILTTFNNYVDSWWKPM